MKPIADAELSAYLDNELDPARRWELTSALSTDPQLQARFDALAAMDGRWAALATQARFAPRIDLAPAVSTRFIAGLVALLVALRFISKLLESTSFSTSLQVLALSALLVWIGRFVTRELGAARAQ